LLDYANTIKGKHTQIIKGFLLMPQAGRHSKALFELLALYQIPELLIAF